MVCPDCQLIEMRLERVEDDVFYFKCKKCGKEITKKTEELEEEQLLLNCPKRAYDNKRCKELIVDGLKTGGLYGRQRVNRYRCT